MVVVDAVSRKQRKHNQCCENLPSVAVQSGVSVHILRAVLVALLRGEGRRRLAGRVLAGQITRVGVRAVGVQVFGLGLGGHKIGKQYTQIGCTGINSFMHMEEYKETEQK